jgi:hypothetical protein
MKAYEGDRHQDQVISLREARGLEEECPVEGKGWGKKSCDGADETWQRGIVTTMHRCLEKGRGDKQELSGIVGSLRSTSYSPHHSITLPMITPLAHAILSNASLCP